MKKYICIFLCMLLTLGLCSCQNSNKQIILSQDTKAALSNSQGKALSLNKIKEFPVDNLDNAPLYWKDNDNFVVLNNPNSNNGSYEFYNINIASGEKTKIGSLDNAYVLNGFDWQFSSIGNTETRIPFIRDLKLYLYDIASNSSREIDDLAEEKAEIEDKYKDSTLERIKDSSGKIIGSSIHTSSDKGNSPAFKLEYPMDLTSDLYVSFVKQSKNYLYIGSPLYLRIIDLNTLKITKIDKKSYSRGLDAARPQAIVYSKFTDSFYLATSTQDYDKNFNYYGVLYEFDIMHPNSMKILKKVNGLDFFNPQSSEDGRYIYFSTYKSNSSDNISSLATDSLLQLDTKTLSLTKLVESTGEDNYNFSNYDYKKGAVFYNFLSKDSKASSRSMFLIGSIADSKLRLIDNLISPPGEGFTAASTSCSIIFNEAGDKFICRLYYYGNTNANKGKTTIYELKNN